MNIPTNLEQRAIDLVARLAPWLAPGPSAFFVARSAQDHLAVPPLIAIIIAAVIETLGISTVASTLRLYDWNQSSLTANGNLKRGRTLAPAGLLWLSIATGAVYVIVTIGLTVVLEVRPTWSTGAPAIFPLLAVVGAINLAIRSNQARRESPDQLTASDRSTDRPQTRARTASNRSNDRSQTGQALVTARSQTSHLPGQALDTDQPQTGQPAHVLTGQPATLGQLDRANQARRATRAQATGQLLQFFDQNPTASHRQAAQQIGRSKSWVTATLADLESTNQIRRNGHGIEVLS